MQDLREVLILGAGRSSAHLIQYLLGQAQELNIRVVVGDAHLQTALDKIQDHPHGMAFGFTADDSGSFETFIAQSSVVVSMLPASMHPTVAKLCLKHKKHLVTPSYLSTEMLEIHEMVQAEGLIFLNEMGVDPGIDHMSAMRIIHQLQSQGATILSFKSWCGGLIAPDSDNNPWNYKITWNPRNVVMAGSGSPALFKENGGVKLIPYHKLFERTEAIHVDGYGGFDGYANRDSMAYEELYGLHCIPTLYRGTLRRQGFCKAWNALVQLGMTDDTRLMQFEEMTMADFTAQFLPQHPKSYLAAFADQEVLFKLQWLGLWDLVPVPIQQGTPAQVIQKLVEERWELAPQDRDMIVMVHQFEYKMEGKTYRLQSNMVQEGQDAVHTAMSATVGWPMAIAVKKILQGHWPELTGVHIPISPEVYNPILEELEELGLKFNEAVVELK